MNYEKPRFTLVASAIEAVKGNPTKETDPFFDCVGFQTQNAYQADE